LLRHPFPLKTICHILDIALPPDRAMLRTRKTVVIIEEVDKVAIPSLYPALISW
jgi:hypothetical protein